MGRLFERCLSLPYPVYLDSASAPSAIARYSFVAADPAVVLRGRGRRTERTDTRTGATHTIDRPILETLREELARMRPAQPVAGLPPFQCGAAGYLGYEYGAVLEHLPAQPTDDLVLPNAVLGIYDWVIASDSVTGCTWAMARGDFTSDAPPQDHARQRLADAVAQVNLALAGRTVAPECHDGARATPPHLTLISTFGPDSYSAAVQRVREYIRAGDIFQANIAQRLSVPLRTDPWTLYRTLRELNPAPFAAYFDSGDAVLVSASPERFLQVSSAGHVETRPIKGTRPRTGSPVADELAQRDLMESGKDRAEHVMIVDVLRNDLGRVCEYGSVCVPELLTLEVHPTVYHMVSSITGQLRRDADALSLLAAAFPGGSITGAPKIRAMEIIAELEPVARGPYCGAIGYVSATGAMDSSIAIRTIIVKDSVAYCSVGGGIVADSEPALEYSETWDKARALLRALGAIDAPSHAARTLPEIISFAPERHASRPGAAGA